MWHAIVQYHMCGSVEICWQFNAMILHYRTGKTYHTYKVTGLWGWFREKFLLKFIAIHEQKHLQHAWHTLTNLSNAKYTSILHHLHAIYPLITLFEQTINMKCQNTPQADVQHSLDYNRLVNEDKSPEHSKFIMQNTENCLGNKGYWSVVNFKSFSCE